MFLILIVCLFTLSAVSAEEIANETNTVANDDSSLIAESVNEDILSGFLSEEEIQGSAENGTFTDLQNRINNATGSLVLPYDFTYNAKIDGDKYQKGVKIYKGLTIDGKGYTISGNNLARIFDIAGYDVKLTNINFVNGHMF